MKNQKLFGFLAAGAFVLGSLAACGSGDIEDAGEMDEIFLESAESLIEGYVDEAITAYQDCDTCDATGGTVEVSSESEETTESSDSDGTTTETSSASTETSSASDVTTASSSSVATAVSSSSTVTATSSSSTATTVSSSSATTTVSSSSVAAESSSSVASSSSEASSSSAGATTEGNSITVTGSATISSLSAGTYSVVITGVTCNLYVNSQGASYSITFESETCADATYYGTCGSSVSDGTYTVSLDTWETSFILGFNCWG